MQILVSAPKLKPLIFLVVLYLFFTEEPCLAQSDVCPLCQEHSNERLAKKVQGLDKLICPICKFWIEKKNINCAQCKNQLNCQICQKYHLLIKLKDLKNELISCETCSSKFKNLNENMNVSLETLACTCEKVLEPEPGTCKCAADGVRCKLCLLYESEQLLRSLVAEEYRCPCCKKEVTMLNAEWKNMAGSFTCTFCNKGVEGFDSQPCPLCMEQVIRCPNCKRVFNSTALAGKAP